VSSPRLPDGRQEGGDLTRKGDQPLAGKLSLINNRQQSSKKLTYISFLEEINTI